MNSVYLSLINLCVRCLSHSLSVSIVNWFPLRNVRNKCKCGHTMRVGMVLVVRPYVHHKHGMRSSRQLTGALSQYFRNLIINQQIRGLALGEQCSRMVG